MDDTPGNITYKSRLSLKEQNMDKLYKTINETERYIDDFYKRMIRKLGKCRVEIQECDPTNLPTLETNKEFKKFLKQDHFPVRLVYAESDDVQYESDFEYEDADSRQSSSEHESDHSENSPRHFTDQVSGKRETDVDLTGARKKHPSGLAAEAHHTTRIKPESVILSSDEVPETSVYARENTDKYESKTTRTPKRSKQHRATTLQDLTERSQYTLDKKEELIFSFPDLKNHLSEGESIQSLHRPKPHMQAMDSGDLELPTCADVKLFETYIITATDENILKLDKKTNKTLGKLPLKFAGQMCSIRQSSCIGVIQTNSFITIVSTEPELRSVYKIKITKAYTNICHIDTYVNTSRNIPDPSFTFGLVYTDTSSARGKYFAEKVDFVKAAATVVYQKIPQYDAQVDAFDLRSFDISGISGIGAVWSEGTLNVILGCAKQIMCLEKSKSQIKKKWEIAIDKAATDVICVKSMAYVCVQDEGRIMLVDKNGKVENENVLQGILQCRPHKVSVYGNTLLVKSFEESRWKNLVFAKQKSTTA